jgi:hypothetical protein
MLDIICKELNNYFETNKVYGTFTISEGSIDLSDLVEDGSLQDGQYFRIVGSVFNDGVYKYPASDLHDEVFEDGSVWPMAVPNKLVELSTEIADWIEKNQEVINSPFQSESFGGYSYTKKSSGSSDGGVNWQSQFKSQLDMWRKPRCRY